MSFGKIEQLENIFSRKNRGTQNYRKFLKKSLHRRERRRMKDTEYTPQYKKYNGWEY